MTSAPLRILVTDDNATDRLLMRAALTKAGFAVSLAVDGEDALRQFHANRCDMVMLDAEMPGLSGYQVCAALRHEVGGDLPIVMVTGMDDTHSIELAYQSGATDFIAKPINWPLIGHRVTYLFRAYRTMLELRAADARNAAILHAIPDTLFRMNDAGMVMEAQCGETPRPRHAPTPGHDLSECYPAEIARSLIDAMHRARRAGKAQSLDFTLPDEQGESRYYETRVAVINSQEALCLVRDITDRKRAELALSQSQATLQQAQAVGRVGSWYLNQETRLVEWSRETYRIFGLAEDTVPSHELFLSLVHPDDMNAVNQAWQATLAGQPYRVEHRIQVNGCVHWILGQAEPAFNEAGVFVSAVGTVQDITERKEAENRIFRLAYFDSLTGLPNRQSFLERLGRAVRRAQQSGNRLGVLMIDLDGFKNVNDTQGHHAGDLILQWAGDRLNQGVRPDDVVSRANDVAGEVEFARLGGDEFTALLRDIARPEDALMIADRLRDSMRRPFMLDGREVVLTVSIGIALCPDDSMDAATLLKHADIAMYHAKEKGRDNCQFYSASLSRLAMQRFNLGNSLRRALDREEFSVVYQPQLDLQAGRVLSVEALIRWNHPEQGLISPMDFIPVAEANGMIVPIGAWVLHAACRDAANWQRAGQGLRVAVNLSPSQFKDPDLLHTVRAVLAETGLAPAMLELEITEGAVMEDSGATMATLNALRASGATISLDDFGTGYSSMSYLKRMPLNNLKVDQSFVKGLPDDRDDDAIVRAILSLAKSLGFSVTAEGVETLEQARLLKGMACDVLQGYYFSKPVPAGDIPLLLTRRWTDELP